MKQILVVVGFLVVVFVLVIFAGIIIKHDSSSQVYVPICGDKPTFTSVEEASRNISEVCALDLSGQQLGEVPPAVFSLVNLQVLFLNGNRLQVVSTNITRLRSLKTLDLTGNNIRNTEVDSLRRQMPKTTILNLPEMHLPAE